MKAKSALVAFLLFLSCFSFVRQAVAVITFTITNPTVSTSDEIEVDASISGLISSSCSTSGCYLQAELRTLDEAKGFFGFTYNNSGEYVDYFSSPSSVDELKSRLFNFTPVSGVWSGKLRLKNNQESTNYVGPGQYAVKFRRFSGNSISATSGDSNALTITLTLVQPTPTPAPISTSTSTPQNSPAPTPTPTKTPTPKPSLVPTLKPSVSPAGTLDTDVLGETSESATVKPTILSSKDKNSKQIVLGARENNIGKILIALGFVFILACGILFSWPHIRKKLKKDE